MAPSKRPIIFDAIRKERGEFGLVQVAAFGTEGTKSAILTACRGYRGEGSKGLVMNSDSSGYHTEGIDISEAQYMSSLIPQERGFLWSIHDVVYGNPEKDRKPVAEFIREVNKYPGLLDVIEAIEGVVNKRSSHASGVILYGEDPFDTAAFMKTPGGDLITCYDLHMAEAAGDTKYDFLVTEISDKIISTFDWLIKDKVIPQDTLRNTYNKYLHPEHLDTTNQELWDHLAAGDILDVFQFSTGVGLAIAKKLKPQNPMEMTAANAMMRLMSEKGKESQQDRYQRIQEQGLEAFDREMREHHLPEDIIQLLHKHCDKYYGCCPIQEQMMEVLMDIVHFSLGEANSARKVVAKKQMDKIPQLREQVYSRLPNNEVADYIWENTIAPQLGYAFSLNHSLPYSFVGIQTLYLATHFNPIYWDTACLIVNSGSLESDIDDDLDEEADDEEKKKRKVATDYGKVAKAIGDIRSKNIEVSLVDINKSDFGFSPDVEHNRILFGLKGMLNVGDEFIEQIIQNRPYVSLKDFYDRIKPDKRAMVSLIKGGAFDGMETRKFAMTWYLWETCDKKKNVNLQNMKALMEYNLIPQDDEKLSIAQRVYEFNRYLKAISKNSKNKTVYTLDVRSVDFLTEIGEDNLIETDECGEDLVMPIKSWEKRYSKWMDYIRSWISENKTSILSTLNGLIFKKDWEKYATGSISAWEMEVLCFYYHEHELAHVNGDKYGFVDFFKLPEEPEVDRVFMKGDRAIEMYQLHHICGTCIAKNKVKGTIALLTPTGVVNVKFRKEYFSLFDKRISQVMMDGKKKVMENSWFNRGNKLVIQGIRRGDDFIAKKYQSSGGHQLYKITSVEPNGDLVLQTERYQGEAEDDI